MKWGNLLTPEKGRGREKGSTLEKRGRGSYTTIRLQLVGLEVGDVWKQSKVEESSEKQEDYQKGTEFGREVKPNVQMGRDEGASIQREWMWAVMEEEARRGWDSMKYWTRNAAEVLHARKYSTEVGTLEKLHQVVFLWA